MPANYPFTAILGQEAMQTALLLGAVDPTIGGVLLRGQKGTAKSTGARALAALLPDLEVVAGCPFQCDPDDRRSLHDGCRERLAELGELPRATLATPFVDLPLSATEDRLIGTLHLERTLESGARQFEPGLLAAAHRGILYVDEVNLLPDHLVDVLLDTAVTGQNLVEREGLRICHPSRFILIGTMNPEEGELRPQLLDRFGLCVTISGLADATLRRRIVMQRLACERDPQGFNREHQAIEEALRRQVGSARSRLATMILPDEVVDRAVALAAAARVQGHRAELALVKAARAHAALLERDHVTLADLGQVAGLALAHRCPGLLELSAADAAARVAALLAEGAANHAPAEPAPAEAAVEDLSFVDDMDFPGAAAAGSMLFTYLKKKLTTGSSTPTKPSA